MVKFDVTPAERAVILKIAERAERELYADGKIKQTRMDTPMDISATIAQGCPLRLDELLAADAFNFAHDVLGIRRHINRQTGQLENCFLPRFAR
jgi:hypothetical protein